MPIFSAEEKWSVLVKQLEEITVRSFRKPRVAFGYKSTKIKCFKSSQNSYLFIFSTYTCYVEI